MSATVQINFLLTYCQRKRYRLFWHRFWVTFPH